MSEFQCIAICPRYADILQQQFNKRYSFPDGPGATPSSDPYKAPYWRDTRLQSMKQRLNATKSKLNEMPLNRWHKHTKKLNPAATVTQELKRRVQPELMTQAWQKFYECFQVLQVLRYVSLSLQFRHKILCTLCKISGVSSWPSEKDWRRFGRANLVQFCPSVRSTGCIRHQVACSYTFHLLSTYVPV